MAGAENRRTEGTHRPHDGSEGYMDDIILAHTATKLAQARGKVVVCGSHGGHYAGLVAAAAGVRAILLNDAGIGLDDAGTRGLLTCAEYGIAAATVSHNSCRIGNAEDTFARGIVSAVNEPAEALGLAPGTAARTAAEALRAAPLPTALPALHAEHRIERRTADARLLEPGPSRPGQLATGHSKESVSAPSGGKLGVSLALGLAPAIP